MSPSDETNHSKLNEKTLTFAFPATLSDLSGADVKQKQPLSN